MARLLLVIAVVVVVYLLVRSYRNNSAPEDSDGVVTEDMVRCAHCGVHLPKIESTLSG